MGWVDLVILGIVGISALIGLARGFLREVLSLVSWVLAYWCSIHFADRLARLFHSFIASDTIRLALAYASIFIAVLLLGAIVNHAVGRLVRATGFGGTDRMFGVGFGVLRGVAILTLLVLLAGMTSIPGAQWWRQSVFLGQVEPVAAWVRDRLPTNLASRIRFSDAQPAAGAADHDFAHGDSLTAGPDR